MDDADKFIAMVAAMRRAQRLYFESRSALALQESKKIEREVDRWLAERADAEQKKLF